jgi:hypothetical protein
MSQSEHRKGVPRTFHVQLDFYWQSIAMYAVTLIVYVIVKSMYYSKVQQGLVVVVLRDPVVVILGAFVALAVIALIAEIITDRAIVVGPDFITFVNRFRQRTFTADDIERTIIGKDRRVRVRPRTPVIRLHIKNRRRPLRIRPSLSDHEDDLVAMVLALRRNHHGTAS